jgi:tetratricopeptide (TPR) repeat protein
LQKDAKFCSAWHEAARVFALQGEEEKTLFNIKKAIDNYPLLECCRLHWLSEEDPLAEYITRIVEENLLDFAWFYGFMGRVFEKSRDPQALSMYKKAIALAPNNSKVSTAYEGIGRIYREKGKYKEAIEYFNKSMEVKPSSPYGYYQIASIYYIQGENLKAINEYEKALEKKKGAYAYLCIGHCWEKEGEIDKAISFYKKAIESFPADPYAPTINRQIHLLEALSRLRLLPLYRWARRAETRMERELARRGLTSRIERITERIRVIYKSKSPMEWIGIGLTILVVFFGIAALGITYLIKRKKIIKPSPERMA